jgi:hypothetical protein
MAAFTAVLPVRAFFIDLVAFAALAWDFVFVGALPERRRARSQVSGRSSGTDRSAVELK